MALAPRSDFPPLSTDPLLSSLKAEEALLQTADKQIHECYSAQSIISPGAEWFRDNFYLVEQTIDQLSRALPSRLIRNLPRNRQLVSDEYPRIYTLALECLRGCENLLDMERTIRTLKTYQLKDNLLMAEIWALPTMFRRCIIGNLAKSVKHLWLAPDSVNTMCDGAQQDPSMSPLRVDLADQSVSRISIGLQEARSSSRHFAKVPAEGISNDEQIVINCVRTLRNFATQDWKAFFEEVSLVEKILSCDPAGVYANMDFETRNNYRGAIEGLASATSWDEPAVANECISLAGCAREGKPERQKNNVESVPDEHIGYYLVGQGLPLLEAALSYCPNRKTLLKRWAQKYVQVSYLGTIILLTVAFSVALGWGVWQIGCNLLQTGSIVLLVLIPVTNVATLLTDRISAYFAPPKMLPKMDFDEGIPAEFKTMVVIPAVVGRADEVDFLMNQLERHYQGNSDQSLGFALLTDFLDAPQQHMPDDHKLLDQLAREVRALNERYSQRGQEPFYLFHRFRTWNPVEDCWMGWERKRGKLIEFNRLLNNEETSFDIQIGNLSFLFGIRYVITLDTDTNLPRESARRLVATLAHPLNQPRFDGEENHVVAGYTILQPRVEIHPASLNRSLFTRIFAGETGLDLYTRAVSDVYQDIFGEGIYVGKGIYEVVAFQRSLDRKIPENTLISHDLLEGLYGRVGLVSDVVFYEDFPPQYLSFIRRFHRWVRGDWQLLPWLFHQVPHAENETERTPFTALDRWKILNNLVKALHTPALFGLLIAGWLWLPSTAWIWWIVVMVLISALEYLGRIFSWSLKRLLGEGNSRLLPTPGNQFGRWLMAVVFLPFESWICFNAIAVTLVRVFVTREHLLRWITSAHILSQYGTDIKPKIYWRHMLPGPLLSLGLFALTALFNPAALLAITPLLAVWLISPQVAWWISRPIQLPVLSFSPDELHLLRRVARRTWLYFERSIGPQTNWLPPDNLQEAPFPSQIVKTSPTNLGLALLSTLAAADSGYIGPRQLTTRLEKAIASLERLPRHNGHFFNWYDIQKLTPIPPYYLSFVDSGNLAACLLALKHGLKEISRQPALNWVRWQGLVDTLAELTEYLAPYVGTDNHSLLHNISHLRDLALLGRNNPDQRDSRLLEMVEREWQNISEELLDSDWSACHEKGRESLDQITMWVDRLDQHLRDLSSDTKLLTPWLFAFSRLPGYFSQADAHPAFAQSWEAFLEAMLITPRLEAIPEICTKGIQHLEHLGRMLTAAEDPSQEIKSALRWCLDLNKEMQVATESAQSILRSLQEISCWAEKTFDEMDFGILFNRQGKVFSIGYDLNTERPDPGNYDLLASETRLASLIAIAKNNVPQTHWVSMARPCARVNGEATLLSWGGSLFEYLMPTLLARTLPETLLDKACRTAISCHITVGNKESLPWGITESSSYPFDAIHGYRYCAFGVKELAINSSLVEEWVIAPYATALALPLQPREAMRNLERLIRLGALGTYGLYEAIHFPDHRIPSFWEGAIVPIYMTHHQGMIMLSLVNCLNHLVMVRRFHADPRIQTVELLLWEAPILHPNLKARGEKGKQPKFLSGQGPF